MATTNRIDAGQARIGYLFDGDPRTPPIAAQLRRDSDGIFIDVPWMDNEPSHVQSRWFGDVEYGDDPEKALFRYEPPSGIDFHDQHGNVVLIGCRDYRSNRRFPVGVGTGTLVADYALLDATGGQRYSRINGLRSEVEGLGAWIGLRSLNAERTFSADQRLATATLQLRSPDPITISSRLNLTIRPAYRYGPGQHPDETTITERMLVETRVSKPRDWLDHLSPHEAIRDLVRVAAWSDFSFQTHEATRDDDPIRTLDGKGHGSQWYKVETSRTGISSPRAVGGNPAFLFTFDDIGPQGVRRWLRINSQMSRAISPIVRLLDLREATAVTHVAQLGIGLEALGFVLAREAGLNKKKAGDERFDERIERLADNCIGPFPIDKANWLASMPRLYNGVKHANRAMPTQLELADGYWQSLLVFRWWLAGRLGARKSAIRNRVEADPMTVRARAAEER